MLCYQVVKLKKINMLMQQDNNKIKLNATYSN